MPIPTQTVVTLMNARLDSEGSDRYLFELDHRPAIHSSLNWCVLAVNSLLSDTKSPAEALRELARTRVWQSSNYSRLAYNSNDLNGERLWTLLSVHPEAHTVEPPTIDPTVQGANSKVRLDLTFLRSEYSADRLTYEQWSQNEKNIFLPGNTTITGALKRYAYLDFSDYRSNTYNPDGTFEIEIRPSWPRKLVAVRYLKYPTLPQLISDDIEFPMSMLNIIVDKSLQFISWKQGDGTNLYSVSERDAQMVMLALSS